MNKTLLALLGTAVLTVGTIGGVAFANSANDNRVEENQQIIVKEEIKAKPVTDDKKDIVDERDYSKDNYQDMINIMRDNGFEDQARYMENEDYDAMTDYMNNISQEDYDQMIEIMKDSEYGYMGEMMESIGREDMIQMHNSMHGGSGRNYNGMMGGF